MRKQIVVARYAEDLKWLDGDTRPSGLSVRVYNKSRDPLGYVPALDKVERLPNVGREPNTYLTHIVDNYDNLADVTMFTQGNPHDHMPQSFDPFSLLSAGPGVSGYRLASALREWDDKGRLIHWGKWLDQYNKGEIRKSELSMAAWFREFMDTDIDGLGSLSYFPGAVFAVTRDVILRQSREFYKLLLLTVSSHPNPEEAYYIERAWLYMWTGAQVNYAIITGSGTGLLLPEPVAMA